MNRRKPKIHNRVGEYLKVLTMKTKILFIICAFCLAGTFASCGDKNDRAIDKYEKLIKKANKTTDLAEKMEILENAEKVASDINEDELTSEQKQRLIKIASSVFEETILDDTKEDVVDYDGIDYDETSLLEEEEEDDDDDDDDDLHLSSSKSEDWDALLKSYEQYVDKYITYVKKAAKGDMSALKEYPSLMQKAEEFGDKMENAQDDMSASQWAKYMKITQKMLSAANDIKIDTKALDKATEDLNSMFNDIDDDVDDDDW